MEQILELGDDGLLILDEMRQISQNKNQLEARFKMLRVKFEDLVGDSDCFVSPDGMPVATYKKSKDSERFDEKTFKGLFPELHGKFKLIREGARRLLFDKSWGGI